MKKLVVFSGAGISAESGIETFRDSDGLWEQHRIEDVATPEAFDKNPELVLEFYNLRRSRIADVKPNAAHTSLSELEGHYDVQIITQNIDDLHERGGSQKILHLHGLITQAIDRHKTEKPIDIAYKPIQMGDKSPKGNQLRPNIVWFGEDVPNYGVGIDLIRQCDVLIVVGTSLNVYPAAAMIHYAPVYAKKYAVDPNLTQAEVGADFTLMNEVAGEALPKLVRELISDA